MSKKKTFWAVTIGNMRVTAFNAENKTISLCPTILVGYKKFTVKELVEFKKVAPLFYLGHDFKYTEYLSLG
ncbi:hypothetical protein [Edaphocola aurantiacus]|uniref:hypothetical protein n=1 Tax=Edaphocola aurantiacus TaxID=2601682 RepID=UPI001C983955|nr:hypothetical protein [Edaphocola aurantiacus]